MKARHDASTILEAVKQGMLERESKVAFTLQDGEVTEEYLDWLPAAEAGASA
jgi:hypothetical protein